MLTMQQRAQNYRCQELLRNRRAVRFPLVLVNDALKGGPGSRPLTPKQQRRVIKKALRLAKIRMAENERREDARIGETLLRLVGEEGGCPTCLAVGDSPCVTGSGNKAKKNHANRPVAV